MRLLKAWLPVIVWAAVILSAANDKLSNDTTAGWLEQLFGALPSFVNFTFRKGGHMVAYAVLGLLGWRAVSSGAAGFSPPASRFGGLKPAAPLLIVLIVAIVDETLQSRTLTRTGSAFDVLLDVCAAALALIAVPAVRARLSSPRG